MWPSSLRNRTRVFQPRYAYLIAVVGAILVAVVVLVGFPQHDGAAEGRSSQPAGTETTSTQMSNGERWTTFVRPTFDPDSAVAVLAWDLQAPVIEFVDLSSGNVTARIHLASQPGAVMRPSAGELLVTDVPWPDEPTPGIPARLLVFDLENQLALKSSVEIPDRAQSLNAAPQLILSADENLAAYVEYTYDLETPACASGEAPSTECDQFRLMVIDLDSGPAVTGSVDLPVGCYPSISSWGTGGGFLAKCRDGDVTLFDADLQVVHPESFASRLGEGDLHEEDWFARPFQAGLSYVFVTDDGGVSGVTGDGVFLRGDDRARILPESTWARGMRMLDGQRTVIAFVYTRTELVPDGMVIVNTETGGVESEVAFDRPGHPFVLQNGDILLLGDGELRILPVGAEASEHVAHVHPGAEEFVD